MLKELDALRAEHADFFAEEDDRYFYVKLLGGKWTATHKKLVSDAASCHARALAVDWCDAFKFPKQAGFYHSVYGAEGARVLGREVARRGTHFFELYLESDDGWTQYSDKELSSYVESIDWVEWLSEQDIMSPQFERGMEIRRILPINPTEA